MCALYVIANALLYITDKREKLAIQAKEEYLLQIDKKPQAKLNYFLVSLMQLLISLKIKHQTRMDSQQKMYLV